MTEHGQFLIKEYSHWNLLIHENQNYLGRMTAWCRRQDALDLADATKNEQEELFRVLAEAKLALKKLFKPDNINYTFLANKTPHLHGGIIPRYASTRTFNGVLFKDNFFGQGYKTDPSFTLSPEVFAEIKKTLSTTLNDL